MACLRNRERPTYAPSYALCIPAAPGSPAVDLHATPVRASAGPLHGCPANAMAHTRRRGGGASPRRALRLDARTCARRGPGYAAANAPAPHTRSWDHGCVYQRGPAQALCMTGLRAVSRKSLTRMIATQHADMRARVMAACSAPRANFAHHARVPEALKTSEGLLSQSRLSSTFGKVLRKSYPQAKTQPVDNYRRRRDRLAVGRLVSR